MFYIVLLTGNSRVLGILHGKTFTATANFAAGHDSVEEGLIYDRTSGNSQMVTVGEYSIAR